MRKVLSIVWVLLLGVFLIAGCGSQEKGNQEKSNSVQSTQHTASSKDMERELKALKNTMNFAPGALEHIFSGQINKRDQVVGYHSEAIPGAAAQVSHRSKPDHKGVYTGAVSIGNKDKEGGGGNSSFFPRDWSAQQVVDAINYAYENRKQRTGAQFEGRTKESIRVVFYLNPNDKIMTAYPLYEGK